MANNTPLEEEEQKVIAEYLDYTVGGRNWCHVPNEGKHKPQYRAKQQRLGLKSGVPDILIFKAPEEYNGVAIEMKRQKGGRVSENQKNWLQSLKENGWLTTVAKGADEAINFLKDNDVV